MLTGKQLKGRLGVYFLSKSAKFEAYYIAKNNRLRRLSESQGHRCAYCSRVCWQHGDETQKWHNNKNQATVEHLYPRYFGGTSHWANTVMACTKCNSTRGSAFDPYEFFEQPKIVRSRDNFQKNFGR